MKKIRFIYNPAAGPASRNTNLLQKSIANIFSGFEYDFFMTTYKGNAQDLATQAIERGFDTIVAIGGDGTFNEILQVSVHKDVKLAIIPTGSGNSLSNYIGMNRDLQSAFIQIKDGVSTVADCFHVSTEDKDYYGITSFSFGLSGDSFFEFNKVKKRTIGRFTFLLYNIFKNFVKKEVTIEINGIRSISKPLEVIVTNINQFGMNVKLMKKAKFNDQKLNFYYSEGGPYWRFLKFIIVNYLGFNDSVADLVSTKSCEEVYITISSPCYAQLDAESILVNGNIVVKIVKSSVNIIVPKNSSALL